MQLYNVVLKCNAGQREKIRELCESQEIKIIDDTQKVYEKRGRPTRFNETEFLKEYEKYLLDGLSATDLRLHFDLEESSFYHKLKHLGLWTRRTYLKKLHENPVETQEELNIMLQGKEDVEPEKEEELRNGCEAVEEEVEYCIDEESLEEEVEYCIDEEPAEEEIEYCIDEESEEELCNDSEEEDFYIDTEPKDEDRE